MFFSQLTSGLRKLVTQFGHHRIPLVGTRQNICMVTLEDQFQNLTSGQVHLMNQVEVNGEHVVGGFVSIRLIVFEICACEVEKLRTSRKFDI